MSQKNRKQQDICMNCNIYHISCMGEKFAWATRPDGQRKLDCRHRVFEVDNTPSPLQVEAFMSLNRRKLAGGMDPLNAFVDAIVQTSDDVYAEAIKNKPDLMEEYYRRKNSKKETVEAL